MKRLVATFTILACFLAVALTEHTCRDGCDYGNTLGGVDLSHLKGVWETVYYSKSEGAIEDNEATFFNISLCGGITGQWQPTQCTSSPTSVCMRSSDNAVFALADTPSCDVTYDSTKRHVQFIYNYSSSAQATFHRGNVTITLICGQHLGVPEVVYGDPHSGNIQIIWVTSAVCTQERQPIHENKCYTIGSNSAAGIEAETYDLSYLIKPKGYKLKSDTLPHAEFTLSLCRPLDLPGNCNGSMFCLSNGSFLSNNAPFPMAFISNSSALQLRNNLLYMEYFSKDALDVCGENSAKDSGKDSVKVRRKIEIRFMCPKDNEIIGPKITFIDGKGCLCTIQWYTWYACGMSAIESASCIIKDHLTKQTKFDLTELGKNLNTALVTGENADRYSYHFSVCSGKGVDIGHCPRDTGGSVVRVSQEYDTTCHSLGSDPGKLKYADGALTMTYSYGDRCHTNFARTSIINFFCPKDVNDLPANTTSRLRFVEEDNCLYTFEWVTPLACPKEEIEHASDCGFQLDKVSYSLAQLIPESDKNWLVLGGSVTLKTSCYMVSACGGLVISGEDYKTGAEFCLAQKAPTTCDGFSVCQVYYNGTGRPLGYFDVTDSSSINSVSDGVFLLNSTKPGSVCPGRKDRTYSTMTYVCKPGALVDPPVLIANYDDCVIELQWQTAVACPLAHYRGDSSNCKIKDPRLNYEYDLSSLSLNSAVYSHYTKPFNYTLNVCGEVECGDGKQVGMCQHDKDQVHNAGVFNSTLEYENGILRAIYRGGDKCRNGQSRNTTIIFQCDHSHVSGLVIDDVTEVHCDYEVTALTNLACPPNYRAVECAFQDKHGRQYDLSQLAKEKFNWEATGTESDNVTYLINVCRPLNKAAGCSPTSAVCEYALPLNGSGSDHKKFLHNLGDASTGHFTVNDNNTVTLTYHSDPPAGSGGCQRLVNIEFECDKDAELDAPPRFLSGGDSQSSCQYYFSWRTRAACPIASEIVKNSCKVTDEVSSYTYDLSPLRSTARDYNLTGSDGNAYWINLCGALVDSKSCSKDSVGCQKPKGSLSSFSLGKSNTEKLKYVDGSIVLTYEGGDVCHHNSRSRIMEVTFQCDNENGSIGRPYFREESDCLYRFLWPTVLVCKPKTIDCIVEGGKYNLKPLSFNRNWHIQNSNVYNDRELYISVCQTLDVSKISSGSCPEGSAACEVYRNGTGRGLGGIYNDLKVVSEGLISLTYSNGKRCPNGDIGKVVTLFRCNREARMGAPRIVAVTDNCEYEMEWETYYACPVTPTVTANCSILDPVTNTMVNLPKVLKKTFFSVNVDHFVYNVSVCGRSIKCGGKNSLPHSGCQAELEGDKRQFSIGLLNETSLELVDGKLRLTYNHGEKCNHVNVHRKTVINFECDRADKLGTLKFKEENNCEYAFVYSVNLDIVCHQAVPKIDCSVPNFDLSPIANLPFLHQPVKLQSKSLLPKYALAMISICHPLNHSNLMAHNCTLGQAACLSGHGVTLDLGKPSDPPVAMATGEGVVLTYKNGGSCEGGKSKSTVLRIVCDTDVGLLSTLSFIGEPPSDKTCEYVFEVKSKSACWLNHTTTEPPTATTATTETDSGTANSGTSATESPTHPTKTNSLSPTLCSISDPAFTKTITFESIDKATGYTTSSEGHNYAVRLCGPLPDKTCGANAAICVGNSRLVSAEHRIAAMSSTSVGFYFPWGSKCKSENRNDTALVLVNCGSKTSLSHNGYYSELCEHRFLLSSPSMCFSDATTFVECMAQPNVSVEYDLSSLMGQTYKGIVIPKPGDTSPFDIDAVGTFNLTVCRSLNPLTEAGDKCDPGNALCVKSIKGGYIGLGHMKTAPTVSPEGHVVLLYEGGNTCGDKDGSKYSAKIHIICNRVMGAPVLMKRPAECMYELEWDNPLACKSKYDKAEAVHCLFNNTITGMEMDLQPLVNLTATTTVDGVRYDVTACGKVVRTSGSKKTTLGTYSGSFNLFSAQGVKLDYSGSNSDKCNADYPYSSTVIMECSRGNDGVGKLVFNKEISNKCHSYFTWWTMYACASTEISCSTELDGKFYDFSELHHSHYWSVTDSKNKFKINICGPITNLPTHSIGCSSEAALCLQLNNYQQKFLELAQTDTQVISSVGQGASRKIMLQYSGVTPASYRNETSCTSYHVKIVMNCGAVSSKPMELLDLKDCTYTFQWSTSLACPERVVSGDNSVSKCTSQIPNDEKKNSFIFYPNKLKRNDDSEMSNNYYAVSEDVHRFFINVCAPVRPQHLYDLSGCGSNSAVCMLVGGHATSLVSTDKVVFSYEDRWLEILMSEGSNRVIIRVECIHDRLFEVTGYHPIGAEHLEFEYNSTSNGSTTYYFSMKTVVGCKATGYEGTTAPTTAPTTPTTPSTGTKEGGGKKNKKGGAGAAVAIVIIVILLSLAIMSLFLLLKNERRRSKVFEKAQWIFGQPSKPISIDSEMQHLIPLESGDDSGKEKDDSSSSEEEHAAISTSGEDEELMDL